MLHRKLAHAPTQHWRLWAADPVFSSRCQWRAPKDEALIIRWTDKSEQWLSRHVMAKLNGAFNKVLRKVLLNKVFTMKTAAITFRPTRHEEWRWKRSQNTPKQAKKKKKKWYMHTNTQGYPVNGQAIFTYSTQNDNERSCKIMCCLGFTINFQIEGRAHTAKQGMPMCMSEPMMLCSNISSRLTFLPALGIPPRLSCACVRDR